jgi:hypothetical protein
MVMHERERERERERILRGALQFHSLVLVNRNDIKHLGSIREAQMSAPGFPILLPGAAQICYDTLCVEWGSDLKGFVPSRWGFPPPTSQSLSAFDKLFDLFQQG